MRSSSNPRPTRKGILRRSYPEWLHLFRNPRIWRVKAGNGHVLDEKDWNYPAGYDMVGSYMKWLKYELM